MLLPRACRVVPSILPRVRRGVSKDYLVERLSLQTTFRQPLGLALGLALEGTVLLLELRHMLVLGIVGAHPGGTLIEGMLMVKRDRREWLERDIEKEKKLRHER
jgi:hypothetical protein